jgi:hypothetical protein
MSEKKKCVCAEPKMTGRDLGGYVGLVTCADCGGTFFYPIKTVKATGDPVKDYINSVEARQPSGTFETALLRILSRIEKHLVGTRKK